MIGDEAICLVFMYWAITVGLEGLGFCFTEWCVNVLSQVAGYGILIYSSFTVAVIHLS